MEDRSDGDGGEDGDGGGYTLVSLDDWDEVGAHLERFCEGEFAVTDERFECRTGGATFAVTREGSVDAGMPLHEFGHQGIDALGFDHAGGSILVKGGGGLRYVFRRPD
ncbi:hypothetical protein [Halegenticoccus soli]|uniref:hypothetical protein n=1 Tax=Halegenticoccus soli TaxID=1985678 RepID=UPI000C6E6E2A|nr:hypothetical protein [Halegenticoccus soli]